jgi:4-diphosphocytidyl-2-C-methyl-D-erythritol kinase
LAAACGKESTVSLAAQLGSDVPFCLEGGTSLGRGRGEIIEPLPPLPHFFVVLANPGFALSTARVYAAYRQQPGALRPDAAAMRDAILSGERDKICASLANSLESAAFSLSPQIAHLKKRMSSAAPSLMCGSGPTVFTLHSSRDEALELYKSLRTEGVTAWITETWAGRKLEVAVID